jgi:Tripartite tricarboxylate transporter TctB family
LPSIDKDIWSGLFFMALGGLGLWFGADYAFGTSARMGPGFLPKLLCWLLVGIGLIVLLIGLVRGSGPMDRWEMRPLLFILAAVLVFGGLIETTGLVAATVGLVLVGAASSTDTRWGETIILAAGLAGASVLIFVRGLGLAMKTLPWGL